MYLSTLAIFSTYHLPTTFLSLFAKTVLLLILKDVRIFAKIKQLRMESFISACIRTVQGSWQEFEKLGVF